MPKKKIKEGDLSGREKYLMRENATLKGKLSFALGVLETVQILIRPVSPEVLEKNLEHLRTTVQRSLEDLKSGL
jgi:hypothetical protein